MSHEMLPIAEAEPVGNVEGNIDGTAMRGAVTLPGSETTSRRKGMRRNLGDLLLPAVARPRAGLGSSNERSRSGRQEESDRSIVLLKGSNKAVRSGGGGRGGKGPGWEKWSMPKHAPDTAPARRVTGGIDRRIETEWAAQAPNIDHARLPARARCGKAARRDLRGRCRVTSASTRPIRPLTPFRAAVSSSASGLASNAKSSWALACPPRSAALAGLGQVLSSDR